MQGCYLLLTPSLDIFLDFFLHKTWNILLGVDVFMSASSFMFPGVTIFKYDLNMEGVTEKIFSSLHLLFFQITE